MQTFSLENSSGSCFLGFMSLDLECEEELQASQVSQLASCVQRMSDHVHHFKDWKVGQIHG